MMFFFSCNSITHKKEQIQLKMIGKLYIVATPIGNPKDITLRALEVLKNVNLILAEDSREFLKLSCFYEIKTKVQSYHLFNEKEKTDKIINLLKLGTNIAMVSDRGTPLISDPGFILVREYIRQGGKPIAVPGASVISSLISISNLGHKFCFLGFATKKELMNFKNLELPIMFFCSPHGLLKMLKFLEENFPEREIIIAKDLTKTYEKVIYSHVGHWGNFEHKGEFTLFLGKNKN